MVTVFYNEDATTRFLEDKSVNIFITHPPFLNIGEDTSSAYEKYGNSAMQLHNVESVEQYIDNILKVIENMSYALVDDGNIFVFLPNLPFTFEIISKIVTETKLKIENSYIWDFSSEKHATNNGTKFFFILHMHGGTFYEDPTVELEQNALRYDLKIENLEEYSDKTYVFDLYPQEISDILIKKFSRPNDIVADVMSGTGTTNISAKNANRNSIYNDVSKEQLMVATLRLGEQNG